MDKAMGYEKVAAARDITTVNISGGVNGQVGVGDNIAMTQTVGALPTPVTEAELTELRQILIDLKAQIEVDAPTEKRAAAAERLDELEEAITGSEPDVATIGYVQGWFKRNLPAVAGAVTSLVLHPIVAKLVTTAGDALAADFARLIGG